jgi:hypothetical protein
VITENCTVITKNCTAVWDALKSTNHSRVIFLCILLSLKTFASLKKIYFNAFSTWKVDSRNTAELFFLCVLRIGVLVLKTFKHYNRLQKLLEDRKAIVPSIFVVLVLLFVCFYQIIL